MTFPVDFEVRAVRAMSDTEDRVEAREIVTDAEGDETLGQRLTFEVPSGTYSNRERVTLDIVA